MKRATTLSALVDRSTPWLTWWQELILNWVASWHEIEILHVTSARTDDVLTWDVPTDLELKRLELEDLLDAPTPNLDRGV
jgi:hypothetical protein